MAPRKNTFDDKLARLRKLADAPEAEAIVELRKLLADDNVFFIGEAAKLVKTLEARALEKDLADACKRLLAGEVADRGCIAKRLLLDVLVMFEAHVPELYLEGLRHKQVEFTPPGPPTDTAGAVRGYCAHALVRIDHPDAILEVAPLLFDDLPEVRMAAAEALASTGEQNCAAILHARLLAGEDESDALGAIYRSLLALAPKRYLPLVGEALRDGQDAAALALGESRLPAALPVLKSGLERASGDLEGTILLSMALLRMEEATAYLRELVEKAPENRAAKAIEALALHRHDARVSDRVAEIVKARKSKKLARMFSEKFGRDV
ncbi:MAG: HEAT repeat domain-containing protein [Polyangiaceae bacterium]|nr:HEAT repeat domain-containing protein [Polyangiaceae bacterium]